MRVVSRPIEPPVALFEQRMPDDGCVLRVLVFRTGLLTAPVIGLLDRLLRYVDCDGTSNSRGSAPASLEESA